MSGDDVLRRCPWVHRLRPWLYQGGWGLAREVPDGVFTDLVLLHGAAERLPSQLTVETAGGAAVSTLLAEDGARLPGLPFLLGRLCAAETALVLCRAGQSRSASLCTRALVERDGLTVVEALEVVFEALRPALWASSRFEPSLITLASCLEGIVEQDALRGHLDALGVEYLEGGSHDL